MRTIVFAAVLPISLTVVTPAEARSWVRVGESETCVDRDSIRRQGVQTYYSQTWCGFSRQGIEDRATDYSYNCQTNYVSEVGKREDEFEGMGDGYQSEDLPAWRSLLCS